MQVTVDAIMLPSQLSNCQEDVNQFLLTLGNLENVPHPPSPAQPPNTATQEALPQELQSITISGSSDMPSKSLSIFDVNIVTDISGYIVCKRRNKFCAVCQENLTSQIDVSQPNQLLLSLKPTLVQRKACLHHHNNFRNSNRSLNVLPYCVFRHVACALCACATCKASNGRY